MVAGRCWDAEEERQRYCYHIECVKPKPREEIVEEVFLAGYGKKSQRPREMAIKSGSMPAGRRTVVKD